MGSNTVSTPGLKDVPAADSRNAEGCPYGRYVDGEPLISPELVEGPGELAEDP